MRILMILSVVMIVGLILAQKDSYAEGPGPVVPNEFRTTSGIPFPSPFICPDNPAGLRAQIVFPAEDFVAGTILGTANRLFDGSPGTPTVSIPDVTIKLSTTQVPVGQLSDTFADNVGPDETTVFQGGLVINSVPGCNTDPCPFPPFGHFQTPFYYDPSAGNLLFEIEFPPCVGGVPSGVQLDTTPVQFPVLLQTLLAGFGSESGSTVNAGFITKFAMNTQRPIPTVSEWGLLAMAGLLGVVGLVVVRRRFSTVK